LQVHRRDACATSEFVGAQARRLCYVKNKIIYEQIAMAVVVSKPYDFVGYWGWCSQREWQLQLMDAIVSRCAKFKAKRFNRQSSNDDKQSDCVWGVAHTDTQVCSEDLSRNYQQEITIASVSAAGLPETPEAWVKMFGECLILGREPFGRAPLYWTRLGETIWFASRLQLLLPVLESQQISVPALYGYSCFSYVPAPLSPVAGIFAVPAGTEVRFFGRNEGDVRTERLREWREAPTLLRDEESAAAQLQTLLFEATHRQIAHLPSEPVGVFLSGGIDSSTIAALLVRSGVKVRAYALDFEPILGQTGTAELPYAQEVAEFLNIPLVKVPVTPQKIRQALTAAASALDLPFGDGATLPLFLLGEVASQETSVVFNGENGDQLFAGWTNKPLIAAGVYNRENPAGAKDFNRHYLDTFHALYGYEAQIYQPDVLAQVRDLNPEDWLLEALDPQFSSNLLARLRRATLMLKGAQNIQPRANNLARYQGMWVRSPFCDLALTEWTFQLPGEFCLRGACEKYILKKAVESWLPPAVVWREKQGMAVPITALCLNSLRNEVRYWLSPWRLREQGIWQPQLPFRVITGQMGGNVRGGRIGRILWLLMMWQVWSTAVLGEKPLSYHPPLASKASTLREAAPRLWRFIKSTPSSKLLYDLLYFPPWGWKRRGIKD
jgi:asparagine synthase (glutamine-hydrolysing)